MLRGAISNNAVVVVRTFILETMKNEEETIYFRLINNLYISTIYCYIMKKKFFFLEIYSTSYYYKKKEEIFFFKKYTMHMLLFIFSTEITYFISIHESRTFFCSLIIIDFI